MKVTALFNGTYPNGGPMAKRLHLYCKGLNELGHTTEIIIPHETVNPRKQQALSYSVQGSYDGVNYRYLSPSLVRSTNFFKRRFSDLKGNIKSLWYLFWTAKPDIILLIDIRNYLAVLVLFLNFFFRLKVVYELNEHPLIFKSKYGVLFDRIFVYPFLDGFIVISKPLQVLLSKINRNRAKIILLPIIVEDKVSELKKNSLADLKTPYILHSGGLIDSKDGIIGMLEAFLMVLERNIELNFFLTGSPDKLLINRLNEVFKENLEALSKVKFLGYLQEDLLKVYQANSTLFIINKPNNLQNNYCFPTKLGEYLSFSKPLIITNVGEVCNYFTDGYNAYVVEPDRPEQIADKIVHIINSPSLSNQVGLQAKKLISSSFDYRLQANNLEAFLLELIVK